MTETLTLGQLNRTFLARQDLLERSADLRAVMHRHIALQAQDILPPYTGLWSRVADFEPATLDDMLESREMIRATTLRTTIQMSLRDDYRMLQAETYMDERKAFVDYLYDISDPDEWRPVARQALSGKRVGRRDIQRMIHEVMPGYTDETFYGFSLATFLGMVRVPRSEGRPHDGPRDLWHLADEWMGEPLLEPGAQRHELVRRYLRAFGPADHHDMTVWSGIRGLRKTFNEMRDELVTYIDPNGYELFDVPEGVIVDPDVPSPLRIVAAFDNALIGHADRSRIIDNHRRIHVMNKFGYGRDGILHDGRIAGFIHLDRGNRLIDAYLLEPIPRDELEAELHPWVEQVVGWEEHTITISDHTGE